MRIIVISDTHGRLKALESIYQAQHGADYYLHLGDGYNDVCAMRAKYPEIPLIAVKGNTDFTAPEPDIKLLSTPRGKLLFTHGHRFQVKLGLDGFIKYANQSGARFALFGHTHIPYYEVMDNIHYMNPGCAEQANKYRFGIIDISDTDIVCVVTSINK